MTSIGALTTTFTPPGDCAASTGIHIVGCGDGCVWWAEGPLGAAHCYPSSYNPSIDHYYSPGICPSGYTPACTSRRSIAQVTETIQTCCPTALGYHYRCVEPTWPWQTSLGCTVYFTDAISTFSFPTVTSIRDGSTVLTSTGRTEVGIGAYGVEIRFQSTDFVPSTTVSATICVWIG
ncbi:Gag polyprotein [Madurella mycetomatis]|uniref:Gag polyprotein n=1 Tax=Madurella mycetomatis TaxID=100816 RepID=A0A175VY43_9PEZI|nr:Gag polyprotein [Madurella mycetomatis]